MTAKPPNERNFSQLDASLLAYVNSESRWQAVKTQLVAPLTIKRQSTATGNVEYEGYPASSNPLDTVRIDSTFLGTSRHLLLVSLIYHMNHVRSSLDSAACLDAASHFKLSHYYQHFSTLIKHHTDPHHGNAHRRRDEQLALMRIWDARIGDYIQGYALKYDFIIDCQVNDPRLYNWEMDSDYNRPNMADHQRSTWAKRFTPLHYYNWIIPGSQLAKLDFFLDPNTSYMYSWLQDYLAKCRLYRIKIGELAKAVKTQETFRKKRDKLSLAFVKQNEALSNRIRAPISRHFIQDTNARRREQIQRQFLQQSGLLYNKFLKQINTLQKK